MSEAGSGVCELTNQSSRDIQEESLKETGAKNRTPHTEVEYSAAAWEGDMKTDAFFECIKTYKPILVVTQNRNYEPEN